jgi:hypothetical protein
MTIMSNFQLDQVQSVQRSTDLSLRLDMVYPVVVLNGETFLTMSVHDHSGQNCGVSVGTVLIYMMVTKKKIYTTGAYNSFYYARFSINLVTIDIRPASLSTSDNSCMTY